MNGNVMNAPQVRIVRQPVTQPVTMPLQTVSQTRIVAPAPQPVEVGAPQRLTSLSRSPAVPQLAGVPTLSSSATSIGGALNAPRLGYAVSSYVQSPPVSSYVAQAPMAPRAPRAPMTTATAVSANKLFQAPQQGLADEFDRVDSNKNGVIERKEWDNEVTREAKLAHEASLESSQGTVETAATDAKEPEAMEKAEVKLPPAVCYAAPEETAPVEKPCCSVPVEAPAEKPAAQQPRQQPTQDTSCFTAIVAWFPCA